MAVASGMLPVHLRCIDKLSTTPLKRGGAQNFSRKSKPPSQKKNDRLSTAVLLCSLKTLMLITCCERNYMHYDWIVKQDKFPLRPDVVVAESPKILTEQLSGCIEHYDYEQ